MITRITRLAAAAFVAALLMFPVTHKVDALFAEIDQAKLAAKAGISLRPSTLLMFGNPALGSLFMTSKPAAGIDWPVRLLVI
ncbi:hypothetical protein BH10PSE7_BH10PSE7_12880 [soil metagenome]